jgi:NAD(P)H dehydrogenase (quinone)
MHEVAQVVSDAAGIPVSYHDMPVEQYTQVLVGAGLPEPVAAVFADGDRGVRDGELEVDPADLERLLGRPATPLHEAVQADVAALKAA